MLLITGCNNVALTGNDLKIKKVTEYLYEATVDYDINYDIARATFDQFRIKPAACSAVNIGNFTGRNLDWYYDNGAEFVVRTTATENRHASIGITSLTNLPADSVVEGGYHPLFETIPFITLDGINDAGVYVNNFVVGYQQMGQWEMKNDNPDDDMFEMLAPRLILDNCTYLTDVMPIYDKYDWISMQDQCEFHILVKGPRSAEDPTITTAVFELIPFNEGGKNIRKICCISADEKDIALVGGDASRFYKINTDFFAVTNFHFWQFDPSQDRIGRLKTTSERPMGFERFETLDEAGKSAIAVAGGQDNVTDRQMMDIMRRAYYTNTYNLFQPNFWYTDHGPMPTNVELMAATEKEMNPCGDINNLMKGKDNKIFEGVKNAVETWAVRDRNAKQRAIWETLHTAIYDYKNRSLKVNVHEGTVFYEYKL